MSASACPIRSGDRCTHQPLLDWQRRHRLQRVSHHVDLLADPGRAVDGPQPSAGRVGHHRRASAGFDGYTGVIPKSSATMAEVLRDYGYKTAAFGKWHNTPATETTAIGPFDVANRRKLASTISTDFWQAKPRNTSRAMSRTQRRSNRRTIPKYHLDRGSGR